VGLQKLLDYQEVLFVGASFSVSEVKSRSAFILNNQI
jgi:hypothetical protein